MKKLNKLLDERIELQQKLALKNDQLLSGVLDFEGSLLEALELGIVRLNFPAPPGFMKRLRNCGNPACSTMSVERARKLPTDCTPMKE